jgi:hypothetical protein
MSPLLGYCLLGREADGGPAGQRVRECRQLRVRSRVRKITPDKAADMLAANTANRPLSRSTVRAFAEAMRRGDWLVTHQGIAFDTRGVLVDGQHRLAAVVEAELPVEMTVFTEVEPDSFDVLDTGKRRNAADVLAIEGEKSTTMLAAMVRTVWLYRNRPDAIWSGGGAAVTNRQIVQTLEANPKIREFVAVGERIATEPGMIKSRPGRRAIWSSSRTSGRNSMTGTRGSSTAPGWPRPTPG